MGVFAACFGIAYALAIAVTAVRVRRLTAVAQRAAVESAAVRSVVPDLVRGTPFENRWQLNGKYRRDGLNLYVVAFKAGTDADLAPFRDNCSAASRWSVVICDVALLESYLDHRGVFAGLAPQRIEPARQAFVAWTIGHEVGHVVAGDEAAHFKPSALNEQVSRGSASHRQELAADAFVIQQLTSNAARRLAVENLALDLLNTEIRREVGAENLPAGAGIVFDYTNVHVVRYLAAGSHPEHFVRAARILEAAGELPGNDVLRRIVEPLIRQLGGES